MKKLFLFLALFVAAQLSAVNYCAPQSWGYCGTSVTGGGSATPTLVSSESALKTALGKGNNVIIITQDITVTNHISSSKSNMTIMALPGKRLISTQQNADYSGILYLKGSNLILRNITFEGPGAYDCDGWDLLCLDGAKNVWVDHCDFQDGCDGNFDNKGLTDNITVSWCRFHYLKAPKAGGKQTDDHRFTNLIGSKSSDAPTDGTYNMTWAFCWWDEGCVERMTRCRNAELHFLNCYWNSSVSKCYVGPENAKCYFEGCTFAGKANTSKLIFKSYGGTNACKFVNCSGNMPSNSGSVSAPSYSYDQMTAANAKTMVTNSSCGAGATLVVTTSGAVSSSCDGGSTPITYYTVTWNANGGSCAVSSSQVEAGQAIGTLPTATKSGYTFNGWYTAATGGTKISASTTVNGNITYYAQYTEESGGGGGTTSDLTWNFSTSDFTSKDSLTIDAGITINGLTIGPKIAYDNNSKTVGSYSFTKRMKTGGKGSAENRYFKFNVTGACTIEVYAISGKSTETRTLNVYANNYGGTLLTQFDVTGSAAAKYSYDYTGTAGSIFICSDNSGINLYAINVVYSGTPTPPTPTYTLSYDENGGSGEMDEQTVNEGTAVSVVANGFTAPEGYSFKEWNSNPNGAGTKYNVGQSVTMNDDLTLYAVWQANTYTVTLNAAGGTGGSASVTATFDEAMPNITIPSRANYNFLGYFSEQNGQGKQYYDANGSSTNSWTTASDATLYAAWEEQSGELPVVTGALHFWFFNAADATTNGVTNDDNVFSNMVASNSSKEGSITIDGTSYSVTRRTGDPSDGKFGSFTIPADKKAIFYALAISSGGADREIDLISSTDTYELSVPGGSGAYQRLESELLPAGTYSIERAATSGNVRIAVIVLKFIEDSTTGFEMIENQSAALKVLRHGQVVIVREGKTYSILGARVD